MLLFSDLIDQDYGVIPRIHFRDPTDGEGLALLLKSVFIFKGLSMF